MVSERSQLGGSESPDKQKDEHKEHKEDVNFPNESDRDAQRVAPLPPARVSIATNSPVTQIACGLHHTVILTQAGEVFTFGSNQYGQLGTGDLQPVLVPVHVKIPGVASQVAAGSNHTVILTSKGVVYTFGNFQKGQLGRLPSDQSAAAPAFGGSSKNELFMNLNDFQADVGSNIVAQRQRFLWNCSPGSITLVFNLFTAGKMN